MQNSAESPIASGRDPAYDEELGHWSKQRFEQSESGYDQPES
ncbi:hypothetical protein [Leptolyngbya sp. FACHB-711]|nr:hypothetical protein [Leptolyngbya sp. FACHB-711]